MDRNSKNDQLIALHYRNTKTLESSDPDEFYC